MKKILAGAVLTIAMCTMANANLTPIYVSTTPSAGTPGDLDFTYTINMDPTQQLLQGPLGINSSVPCYGMGGATVTCPGGSSSVTSPFVTIYDVPGLVTASASAAGWNTMMPMVGITAGVGAGGGAEAPVTDSAALQNVTFYYTGPNDCGSNTNCPVGTSVGPDVISGFTITVLPQYSGTQNGGFTAVAYKLTDESTNGTIANNQGEVIIPANTVPEPASAALIGFGLLGLGFGVRRFKASR